jgi:hypothetical protein
MKSIPTFPTQQWTFLPPRKTVRQTQEIPTPPFPSERLTSTLLATPHRFLLHSPTNTAILSDLHLDIEHTMRQQGLASPNLNPEVIRNAPVIDPMQQFAIYRIHIPQ